MDVLAASGDIKKAADAAATGGTNVGTTMPTPATDRTLVGADLLNLRRVQGLTAFSTRSHSPVSLIGARAPSRACDAATDGPTAIRPRARE